ncbi:helix-turn-helix domain-containing protein [Sphingobacterium mizutaii]|uniref:helix-turn-helix domain-containing protein n=1 Tax=Sphingobacterium mizutaii TaxID=1010 RepID=UPI001629A9D9|nr:helix-turn-helix domain-containing protein [Sphingobacterium mizutaii]
MNLELIIKGALVGGMFLLAFLNFSNAIRVNRKANLWFGFFVLLWSTFWLDELIFPDNQITNYSAYILFRTVQFFVPLSFLISVYYYTNPQYNWKAKDSLLFLLPIAFLSILILGKGNPQGFYKPILLLLFFIQALLCTVLAYLKVRKHQKVIQSFSSNTMNIDLRWIKYIIYCCIISSVLILIYNLVFPETNLNIIINLFFMGVLYLVAFYSMRQGEIYPKGIDVDKTLDIADEVDGEQSEHKIKLLSDEDLIHYKAELSQLMIQEELFLDSELNLLKLANRLGITVHQLSYIINSGFGMNFFQYINRFRVDKAKELLVDETMIPYNMISIGYASGFNSKTAFNTVFKNITGLTPTEFRNSRK